MLPSTDAGVTGAESIRKDNVNGMAIRMGCEAKVHIVHGAAGPGGYRRIGSPFLEARSMFRAKEAEHSLLPPALS